MEFERTARRKVGALILTPLIDIMFILIIFFMLTASFMRIESLELMLPSASGKAPEKQTALHLFIQPNGDMFLGQRKLGSEELTESLVRMFDKDPATKIMLLTADGVTMQQLVNIMDRVYTAGGRSLFVRKWENAPKSGAPADSQKKKGN
jgi:biopolymer transport protein ExbD